MMDEEIRQALNEVREMKQMCGNINMKLTNIVTQRGQDWKKKLEAEYQRGLEDGKKAFDLLGAERDSEYQRGLDDAWECARKLFSSMADSDIEKAFPVEWNNGGFNALINLQPQEAIERLKAYEEKQTDKIKVGDVVMIKQFKHPENHLFVVTKVSDESVWGVEGDGSWNYWAINEVIKTDKHFDIASILEEMRHD